MDLIQKVKQSENPNINICQEVEQWNCHIITSYNVDILQKDPDIFGIKNEKELQIIKENNKALCIDFRQKIDELQKGSRRSADQVDNLLTRELYHHVIEKMEAKRNIHILGEENKALRKAFNRKTNELHFFWMKSDKCKSLYKHYTKAINQKTFTKNQSFGE